METTPPPLAPAALHSQPILAFESASFQYESHEPTIVKHVSFELKPHTFTAIVGPSGGGKSTILRLVAGLIRPTQGNVINNARTRMIFQSAALLPWRTVRDNVLLGFNGLTLSAHEREKRLHAELQNLGLTDLAHAYPRDLSGGQRQRVGIARALVSGPELLLLDEPFSALDVETTSHLADELLAIFAARNITMLMVSHNIEDAVQLADQVLVFSGGTVAHTVPISLPRPRPHEDVHVEKLVKEIKKMIPARM